MTRRELVAIPMADGVELSATLFFPEGDGPWPAVMEALPYRKDDLTAAYRSNVQGFQVFPTAVNDFWPVEIT